MGRYEHCFYNASVKTALTLFMSCKDWIAQQSGEGLPLELGGVRGSSGSTGSSAISSSITRLKANTPPRIPADQAPQLTRMFKDALSGFDNGYDP